jgi:hypothetical protein
MFENKVLGKKEEVIGTGRECITRSYMMCTPNIIRVIRSRRMRWAGHVAFTEKTGAYRFWWAHVRERNHLEDLGVGRRIILKWILRSVMGSID